jgi:hypothetical protein
MRAVVRIALATRRIGLPCHLRSSARREVDPHKCPTNDIFDLFILFKGF